MRRVKPLPRLVPARPASVLLLWALLLGLALAQLGCGMAYIGEEPLPRSTKFEGFTGRLVDSESGDGVGSAKVMIKPADELDSGKPFYIYSLGDGSFQLRNFKRQGVSTPFEIGDDYQLIISSVNHRIKDFKVTFDGGEQKLGAIELMRVEEGGGAEMIILGTLDDEERQELPTPTRMGPPLP